MRYDTMEKRLADLFDCQNGEHIEKVLISLKCKTKDGMVYTMDGREFDKQPGQSKDHFRDLIFSGTLMEVLEFQELVARDPDGFRVSCHECVAVKSSEIIRIWADIEESWVTGPSLEQHAE
jgi:hypothetical protein